MTEELDNQEVVLKRITSFQKEEELAQKLEEMVVEENESPELHKGFNRYQNN